MVYAGARENTAEQMAETMHFSLEQKKLHPTFGVLRTTLNAVQEKGHVTLHVANSLWPQKDYLFLKEYQGLVKKYYGVVISQVDYKQKPEAAAGCFPCRLPVSFPDKGEGYRQPFIHGPGC